MLPMDQLITNVSEAARDIVAALPDVAEEYEAPVNSLAMVVCCLIAQGFINAGMDKDEFIAKFSKAMDIGPMPKSMHTRQ